MTFEELKTVTGKLLRSGTSVWVIRTHYGNMISRELDHRVGALEGEKREARKEAKRLALAGLESDDYDLQEAWLVQAKKVVEIQREIDVAEYQLDRELGLV